MSQETRAGNCTTDLRLWRESDLKNLSQTDTFRPSYLYFYVKSHAQIVKSYLLH